MVVCMYGLGKLSNHYLMWYSDLLCLEFPLSDEPNFGTWRVDVNVLVSAIILAMLHIQITD